MRIYPLLAFVSLLLASACETSIPRTQVAEQVVAQYGAWDVVCDNKRLNCLAVIRATEISTQHRGSEVPYSVLHIYGQLTPEDKEAAAGFSIQLPLETDINAGLTFSVDGIPTKKYPLAVCAKEHCLVRAGFSKRDLRHMERGKIATLTIFAAAAPNAPFVTRVPLNGLSQALSDAHKRSN